MKHREKIGVIHGLFSVNPSLTDEEIRLALKEVKKILDKNSQNQFAHQLSIILLNSPSQLNTALLLSIINDLIDNNIELTNHCARLASMQPPSLT